VPSIGTSVLSTGGCVLPPNRSASKSEVSWSKLVSVFVKSWGSVCCDFGVLIFKTYFSFKFFF
jgi:hypothetical protein